MKYGHLLYIENKQQALQKMFEKAFPMADVQMEFYNIREFINVADLTLRFEHKDGLIVKVFQLTEFDCEECPNLGTERTMTANITFPAPKIRKLYLNFMAKNFPEYEDDYNYRVIQQANEDLGLK